MKRRLLETRGSEPEELELRNFEMRLAGDDNQPVLTGYAAVFNQDSTGLFFSERIRPGAFKRSLEAKQDVLALVDHDRAKVIGRVSNGTLSLREDDKGLLVEIRPNMETTFGRDVVANVKRRDITNMSFGFIAKKDAWTPDKTGKNVAREIIEADLREVSIVSMPAYAGTSIQKREEELDMTKKERELRQKLAGLKERHSAILGKDNLTDEERAEQLSLAKEIRSIEAQIAEIAKEAPAEAPAAAPVAVVPAPASDEQRAFNVYLRTGETRALNVGTDAGGGVLAPQGFIAEVLRARQETAVMRRVARVIGPVNSAQVEIPRSLTGVTATWLAENAAIVPGDPSFDKLTFTLHKMGALTQVSNELLADSGINVEALLSQLFGEALAKLEDAAFFNGNVAGQPKGILQDANIQTVAAAAGAAVSVDDILNLYDAVPPQYQGTAVWVMNPATMSLLRKLKDTAGRLMLTSDLTGPAPITLLGRPVYLSSNMPAVALNAKSILFGDLRDAYIIVDHANLGVQRSADRYFEADQVAFRVIARVDGQVALPEAVRILKQPAA
ncbi:MAG: phage major capsid protein [Firmicutes bacterium]|nr:phage major capsid protein [Bacillota bacterium]